MNAPGWPGANSAGSALSPLHRAYFLMVGLFAMWVGVWGTFMPSRVALALPWQVPALHSRVIGAMYLSGWILALGAMMLSAAHENDRTRARIISPFLVLLLPAVVLEVSRFADQVTWSHPGIVGGLAVLVATFTIGVYLARGDWRRTLQ